MKLQPVEALDRLTCRPASWTRWMLLSALLLTTAGCGGCSNDGGDAAAEAEQQPAEDAEKKKQKDFEFGPLLPVFSRTIVDADTSEPIPLVKPGHWTAAMQQMQANYDDFYGRSVAAAVDPDQGRPLPVEHTQFALVSQRPVVLARKRPKWLTSEVFVPQEVNRVYIGSHVERGDSGQRLEDGEKTQRWTTMPAYQYFLLVLARDPDRYAWLKLTDAVRGPWESEAENFSFYYRVAMFDGEQRLPLPPNVLAWTSVAYLLWDEVNLDRLEQDQREALVDWIHWGGRLIVNGPDSLASLRGSFLDNYLPADPGDAVGVGESRLASLVDYWGSRSEGSPAGRLVPELPWSGIELQLRPEARYLPHTAKLFAEQQVGRGSVVVSAFQLSEREWINWPGYDGFFNGALLARPRRRFSPGEYGGYRATWADFPERRLDSSLSTPVRLFARDATFGKASADAPTPRGGQFTGETELAAGVEDNRSRGGGLGAWNDFSPLSAAARSALREAAGVRVPGAGFVVGCLALYLVVLVPLNWMVFQTLGRVEWAWLAAPVIAVGGTVLIVYQANLDIGFVRAQTEIAFLELQGDYPRGHLSRYDALYASLATSYNVEFESQTAVAKPFPRDDQWNPIASDRPTVLKFEKYDETRLAGIAITSASTQLVHSEAMIDLDGALRLSQATSGAVQIENQTSLDLYDAVIVERRFPKGKQEPVLAGFWLGRLRSGESRAIPLTPLQPGSEQLPFAEERAEAARLDYRTRLDVDALLRLAFHFDSSPQKETETRLVARVDETILPGIEVQPQPSQATGATVVLAHLKVGRGGDALPDVNRAADVSRRRAADFFKTWEP